MEIIYRQVNVSEKAKELTSEVGRAPQRTGQDGLAISWVQKERFLGQISMERAANFVATATSICSFCCLSLMNLMARQKTYITWWLLLLQIIPFCRILKRETMDNGLLTLLVNSQSWLLPSAEGQKDFQLNRCAIRTESGKHEWARFLFLTAVPYTSAVSKKVIPLSILASNASCASFSLLSVKLIKSSQLPFTSATE